MGVSISNKHSTTRQKTREGINCDAHRSVSSGHSQRDRLAHSICLETGTANSKMDSVGQQDIFGWNIFLWNIADRQGIR